MKNKLYFIFLCFMFCAAKAQDSNLKGDAVVVTPAPEQTKRTKLEQAAVDTIIESIQRDTDLQTKLVKLEEKINALLKSVPNVDSKKSIKDLLTASQLDEFNMLTAQMRYVQFSIYAEVLKRRKIRAIISLLEMEEKDDELFANLISSGNNSYIESSSGISNKLKGLGLSEWEAIMNLLNEAQNNKDARTIPLKNLVSQLKVAKLGPSCASDNLGFLNGASFGDDLKGTTAYKIFLDRLDSELKKGNKDAAEVTNYLTEEMNGNKSSEPATP